MKSSLAIVAAALLIAGCAHQRSGLPEQARLIGDKVATWQLSHMDRFDYVRTFQDQTEQDTGWIQAAFYIGLARWADAADNPDYVSALLERAEASDWQIGPLWWHADDQAIAQVYLFLAAKGKGARIGPVIEAFDRVLASPPENPLEFRQEDSSQSEGTCQRRWCWCDALFMAPPAWAMLSNLTNDPKYRDYMLQEYFATRDYLYDNEAHLFYRDSRFFQQRTSFGNKVFWSRGNGWVFAGLPLLLEELPAEHPRRADLIRLYREMAATFREVQHQRGYWAPSLLDVQQSRVPETSGTAFITFGLAWGVNRNILPDEEYSEVVENGWSAIVRAIDRSGRPGWVQQVGNAPDDVKPGDTQLYGSGAVLLAVSEMLRYGS